MDVGTTTAQASRDEFLLLLTTQLRHQDPMDPVKQENFLSQLAQFSTLEGIENLNANFEDMLRMQELTQGANLLGKTVSFSAGGGGGMETGVVEGIRSQDNRLYLSVNGRSVPIDQIVELVATV